MELLSWFISCPSNFRDYCWGCNTHPAPPRSVQEGLRWQCSSSWGSLRGSGAAASPRYQPDMTMQLQSVKRPEAQSQVSWVLILTLPSAWLYCLKRVFALSLTFLTCKMRGLDEVTSEVPLTLKCEDDSELSRSSQERWWGEVIAPTKSMGTLDLSGGGREVAGRASWDYLLKCWFHLMGLRGHRPQTESRASPQPPPSFNSQSCERAGVRTPLRGPALCPTSPGMVWHVV